MAVEVGANAKGINERDYADKHLGVAHATVSAAIAGWPIMTGNAMLLRHFLATCDVGDVAAAK